jgi:hypothetical protein
MAALTAGTIVGYDLEVPCWHTGMHTLLCRMPAPIPSAVSALGVQHFEAGGAEACKREVVRKGV